MAVVVSSLLSSPVRLFTPFRVQLAVRGRITCLRLSSQRRCTSDTSNLSDDHLSPGLQKYKDLQNYFKKRLKAAYRRFSSTQDHSVVCGHHHVYFIEGDGIYRMDKSRRDPEQVLNLEQVPGGEDKTGPERGERFHWAVQRIRLSPQEKHLAATLKSNHREEPRCVVVRLAREKSPLDPSNIILTLDNVFSFEWATDEVMFYTSLEGLRCSRAFRLDMTLSGSRITTVYEENRPDVFVEVALSRDRRILSINCNSRTSSEVLLIDTTKNSLVPHLIQPRQQDLLYHVEHWRGWLIILANTGLGQEYQVVQAPLSEPSMLSWVSLFTPGPGNVVKDMDIVGDYCMLVARTPANELVLIVVPLMHPKKAYTLPLPSWACAIETKKPGLADKLEALEILISSPVHPPVPYCLYPEDGLLLSHSEDGFSPENQDNNTITRLQACSQDGALVPLTLFSAVPVEGLRPAPLLVHVYGAYGRDLCMDFCPEKRLLLEQGWVLAYCHVRGGAEQGLSWQRQAREDGKEKGVEDLYTCLQHLFSLGVSSPSLTALTACSAGAVPVGALCNRHPHMMRAVTLQAPFLDVLGTMEDPSLPLTMEDREEWGDPVANQKHRLSIASYCPLHNITPQCYPSMLLTAYRGDARIPLTGVLKYTQRLKEAVHTHFTTNPKQEQKSAPNIVLNIQPGLSHFGPEDFELMMEEEALNLAFLYKELSLEPPRRKRKRK
ncbi:prolyl endopeptidase-like [Solea senegalensis]|uniref:Prolyl endopeptidase-like n=1 Tax=Solea senegalensis TaxID=28829 RepID=A0AAV6S730_SOLSE|nr:prolyl endopeptidase-like [Solea senegalensis]KAG7512974.1 prolyl endopeptidase-like [Solea senegalensis]